MTRSSRSPEAPELEWLLAAPFAHRGLHGPAGSGPENSLAAFEAAVRAGYGIELDVRLSADGAPVVFHDATLDRLTAGRGAIVARPVRELKALRLAGTDERIPTFVETLDLVRGRVPLLVEIKNAERRAWPLESAVWRLLKTYGGPAGVLSFNPASLAWFRRRAPVVPRGLNVSMEARRRLGARTRLAEFLARPHFLSYDVQALNAHVAARAKARGLPLICWTVRTSVEQARARQHAANYMFEGFRP